jgi:hypothetical protein
MCIHKAKMPIIEAYIFSSYRDNLIIEKLSWLKIFACFPGLCEVVFCVWPSAVGKQITFILCWLLPITPGIVKFILFINQASIVISKF